VQVAGLLVWKPGNVGEFDSYRGNVRDFTKSQGNVKEKILSVHLSVTNAYLSGIGLNGPAVLAAVSGSIVVS